MVKILFNSKEVTLKAHKNVLAAHSPVFQRMFISSKFNEANDGIVKIDDLDPEAVGISFFHFILFINSHKNLCN